MKQGASTILLDISDGDPNPNRARHGHGDGEASKKSAVDGGRRAAASTADRPPSIYWSLIHPTKNLSTAFPPKTFLIIDMSWSTVSVFTPSSHALKYRRVIALIQYYLIRCYNIKLQCIADNNIAECLIFIQIYSQQ